MCESRQLREGFCRNYWKLFGFVVARTSLASSASRCRNSRQIVGWHASDDGSNCCYSRRNSKRSCLYERIVNGGTAEKSSPILLLLIKFDPRLGWTPGFDIFIIVIWAFCARNDDVRIRLFILVAQEKSVPA